MARDNLRLGSIGLFPRDWAEAYYPPDLPEDWAFDFYANEQPVALLTPAELDARCAVHGVDDWAELLAELQNDDFRLWLDLRHAPAPAAGALRALGERLEGTVGEAPQGFAGAPHWREEACWSAQRPQCSGPGLLRLSGEESPRELRALLESFDQACALEAPVLFVEAPRAAFETVQTLIELMGL